jgi:hypothetical protein
MCGAPWKVAIISWYMLDNSYLKYHWITIYHGLMTTFHDNLSFLNFGESPHSKWLWWTHQGAPEDFLRFCETLKVNEASKTEKYEDWRDDRWMQLQEKHVPQPLHLVVSILFQSTDPKTQTVKHRNLVTQLNMLQKLAWGFRHSHEKLPFL